MSNNWYFQLQQVEQSPSRNEGMIPSKELEIVSGMWHTMREIGKGLGMYINRIINMHL